MAGNVVNEHYTSHQSPRPILKFSFIAKQQNVSGTNTKTKSIAHEKSTRTPIFLFGSKLFVCRLCDERNGIFSQKQKYKFKLAVYNSGILHE
jgi:hypothetical protein